MSARQEMDNLIEYQKRFGDLPDSRLMPDEVLGRIDELVAIALARGRKITDKEGQLGSAPEGATI